MSVVADVRTSLVSMQPYLSALVLSNFHSPSYPVREVSLLSDVAADLPCFLSPCHTIVLFPAAFTVLVSFSAAVWCARAVATELECCRLQWRR